MSMNQASRQFRATTSPLQSVFAAAHSLYVNLAAVFDVILRARTVTANVQQMADMLEEARRIEERSPERAARLRAAAYRLELA